MMNSGSSWKNYSSSIHDDRSVMMAHEAETVIPGSFVVMQGNSGDSMINTISTLPQLPYLVDSNGGGILSLDPPGNDEKEDRHHRRQQQKTSSIARHTVSSGNSSSSSTSIPPETPLLGNLANQNRATVAVGLMSGVPTAAAAINAIAAGNTDNNNDDFIPDNMNNRSGHEQLLCHQELIDEAAIEEWRQSLDLQAIRRRKEFHENFTNISSHTVMFDSDMFWQSEGSLCVFNSIPTKLPDGTVLRSVMGTLSPGCTVVCHEVVYLDSKTLIRLPVNPLLRSTGGMAPHTVYPKGRIGWIQMVRLDFETTVASSHGRGEGTCVEDSRSRTGYSCLSLDGYPLMVPGLPSLYTDPQVNVWRITCPVGCYVREGLSLQSNHLETLPYGSLIRVTRRTINGQGLSRLLVQHMLTEDASKTQRQTSGNNTQQQHHDKRWIEGWVSEFLNPQSGQRGVVAQPLPFPVPALYRVTLALGAVIRSDIELSSPQIGIAPQGSIISIIGRSFSESPSEKCLERLQLAGDGGWISVRLNRPPPHDDLIVEFVSIDSQFHPEQAGKYHLHAQRAVHAAAKGDGSNSNNNDGHPSNTQMTTSRENTPSSSISEDIFPIDDSPEPSDSSSNVNAKTTYYRLPNKSSNHESSSSNIKISKADYSRRCGENAKCLICLTEERNATIVHGETGHVACCLVCARILKARGDKVCSRMLIGHRWFHDLRSLL